MFISSASGDEHLHRSIPSSRCPSTSLDHPYRAGDRLVQDHRRGRWHVEPFLAHRGADQDVVCSIPEFLQPRQLLLRGHAGDPIRTIGLAHEPRWSRTFDRGEHPFEDHDRISEFREHEYSALGINGERLPYQPAHLTRFRMELLGVAQGPTKVPDRLESEEPLGSLPFLGGGPLKVRTGGGEVLCPEQIDDAMDAS